MGFDIKIERAVNGYILKYKNENDCDVFEVFEADETKEDGEHIAFKYMVYRLTDILGPAINHHKKHNIFICVDEDCKVREFKEDLDDK